MKEPSLHGADDFAARIQRQPIREIPQDWRAEILAAARSAASADGSSAASARSDWRRRLSTFISGLSVMLWPSPKAWAGLALVWVAILVINNTAATQPIASTSAAHRPPAGMQMARREEQRVLAELLGQSPEQSEGESPRSSRPRPRSELTRNTLNG